MAVKCSRNCYIISVVCSSILLIKYSVETTNLVWRQKNDCIGRGIVWSPSRSSPDKFLRFGISVDGSKGPYLISILLNHDSVFLLPVVNKKNPDHFCKMAADSGFWQILWWDEVHELELWPLTVPHHLAGCWGVVTGKWVVPHRFTVFNVFNG